jgi:hypothetical protein
VLIPLVSYYPCCYLTLTKGITLLFPDDCFCYETVVFIIQVEVDGCADLHQLRIVYGSRLSDDTIVFIIFRCADSERLRIFFC